MENYLFCKPTGKPVCISNQNFAKNRLKHSAFTTIQSEVLQLVICFDQFPSWLCKWGGLPVGLGFAVNMLIYLLVIMMFLGICTVFYSYFIIHFVPKSTLTTKTVQRDITRPNHFKYPLIKLKLIPTNQSQELEKSKLNLKSSKQPTKQLT